MNWNNYIAFQEIIGSLKTMTSCKGFFHIWQQLQLCVCNEGQGGAWVVCSRCPIWKKTNKTPTGVRSYLLLDDTVYERDFIQTKLTSQLGECTTLQLWENQNWWHCRHFGNLHPWRPHTPCLLSCKKHFIKKKMFKPQEKKELYLLITLSPSSDILAGFN